MTETYNREVLGYDTESDARFVRLSRLGKAMFSNTRLDPKNREPLQAEDVQLFAAFVRAADPHIDEYKLTPNGSDRSSYGNYANRGGLEEHFELSLQGAPIVLRTILENLKSEEDVPEKWREQWRAIRDMNLHRFTIAAAGHDMGKWITFEFAPGEEYGNKLMRRITRPDLVQLGVSEDIMLAPEGGMVEAIRTSPGGAFAVRIVDEFCKRAGNNTHTPQTYDEWDARAWAGGYADLEKRPSSGRPADLEWRELAPQHAANKEPYFLALEECLGAIAHAPVDPRSGNQRPGGLHLGDIAKALHRGLGIPMILHSHEGAKEGEKEEAK